MTRTNRTLLAGAAATLLLALGAAAAAQEEIDRAVNAPADGTVIISNVSGSIVVTGWDEGRVRVTGTLGKGTERLELENEGRRTIVKVVLPKHSRHVEGSELTVRVPKGSRVEVEAVSAGVEASGVTGELDLHSVSGDVNAGGDPRETTVQTVSGDIGLTVSSAKVTAESVSGDIDIRDARGEIEINSVSGETRLAADQVKRLGFNSVSGGLDFTGAPARDAVFEIECHSGSVTLNLPAKVDGDFELSTFSGDIVNDFGPKAKRTSKYAPGRELEFTTGSGNARFEISTFSGDILLKTR